MRQEVVRTVVISIAGALCAVLIAAASGWPARDTAATVAIAGGSAVVASIGGAFVLRRFRGRSTRAQALVIAVGALVALVVGIVVSAAAMFISEHDLAALAVVVAVSASVAVGAALQMGDDMAKGTVVVGEIAERLAGGEPLDDVVVGGPAEMRELAVLLVAVSRRLEESSRRERTLESSRRELIAWVSHDLRSPLATIRAMSEALDDHVVDDPETVARYHSQLRRDAERLSTLVDDLFELSRINSGTLELTRRPVCLTEVVGDAIAAARTHAALKGVRLLDDVDDLPRMEVSATEVTRVLHNLLDNAIRHTPAGGHVMVRGTTTAEEATLVVADQCGGIPESDLTRVFDVAFRNDAARVKDDRGGGLGLAIAKGLVEAHDGSIDVGNEGDGCRFMVRLPRSVVR